MVLGAGLDPTTTRDLAGGLSLGMPSALVPTIPLTRRRDLMGRSPTGPSPPAAASAVAALIISLNTLLVGDTFAT